MCELPIARSGVSPRLGQVTKPHSTTAGALHSFGRLEDNRSCAVRCIQLVLGVTATSSNLLWPLKLSELQLPRGTQHGNWYAESKHLCCAHTSEVPALWELHSRINFHIVCVVCRPKPEL